MAVLCDLRVFLLLIYSKSYINDHNVDSDQMLCYAAFNPPIIFATDRSNAMVPMMF